MSHLSSRLNLIRACLRDNSITLRASATIPGRLENSIKRALADERGRARTLFRGIVATQGPQNIYLTGMETVFNKVAKASVRAFEKGLISPSEEVKSKADFVGLAVQYRAMIILLSQFRDVNDGSNFIHAAHLTPYHDPENLASTLSQLTNLSDTEIFHVLST